METMDALAADKWKRTGDAQFGAGKWSQALQSYQQALLLRPDCAEFAFHLGAALHRLGRPELAEEYFRQALRLKPDYAAACSQLAMSLSEQGALDEAVPRFQESLRYQPDQAFVYYCLSQFAAEGRYHVSAAEIARMKALLASEHVSLGERSLAGFAVARVLHNQGLYDEAFSYYEAANHLGREHHQNQYKAFNAPAHEALVDRLMDAYDGAHFRRVRGWGTDSEAPIFIVGMPRSGSTLVEQILASHGEVYGAGEITDIHQFIMQFTTNPEDDGFALPFLPDMGTTRNVGASFLNWLAKLSHGAGRVTIKTLHNFLHLGLITTLFPRARIIHCRRDPLDVCLSCFFTHQPSVNFSWSLEDIGTYHLSYERLMAHWSHALPAAIHEVRYEELIRDQESVTRKLLAFCDLDWDERCLKFWKTRRAVLTASTIQVRKPISDGAIGRWKHYRAYLAPLLSALGIVEKRQVPRTGASPPVTPFGAGTPVGAAANAGYLNQLG